MQVHAQADFVRAVFATDTHRWVELVWREAVHLGDAILVHHEPGQQTVRPLVALGVRRYGDDLSLVGSSGGYFNFMLHSDWDNPAKN